MKTIVSVLVLVTSLMARAGDLHHDPAYIDKMTLTLIQLNDQEAFNDFVIGAHDRNFLIHQRMYIPDIKSNYSAWDATRDTLEASGNLMGLKNPLLAASIKAGLGVVNVTDKIYDKHFASPDKILSFQETRGVVAQSLAAAEKNGSLPYLLAALGHRTGTNVAMGDFQNSIETVVTQKEMQTLMRLGFDGTTKSLDNISGHILFVIRDMKALTKQAAQAKREADELARRNAPLKIIQDDFDRRQTLIETRQSQLTVLSVLASSFGIENARKPLAIAQFGVTTASAVNTWSAASAKYAGNAAKLSAANWAMAANVATAALMAYQMMEAQDGNAAVMAELAAIKEMLETIDKKLSYLIELSERNFERIITSLDQQRFILDAVLKNTDLTVKKLYSNDMIAHANRARVVEETYKTWTRQCNNGRSQYCDIEANLNKIYENVTSRAHGLDARVVKDREINIINLSMDPIGDELEEYRRFSSGPYLMKYVRALIEQRLQTSRSMTKEMTAYYKQSLQNLAVTSEDPVDFGNPKVWADSVEAIEMLVNKQRAKPNGKMIEGVQTEGRKIENYYRLVSSINMHEILRLELGAAANVVEARINSLKQQMYLNFASPLGDKQAVYSVPHNNIYTCNPTRHGAWSVNEEKLKKILYEMPEYRRFALLQKLGAGDIQQCYFFNGFDGDDRLPMITYVRFVWKEDKKQLAAHFKLPLANAVKNENLPKMCVVGSNPCVPPPIAQYSHLETAVDTKRSTFILGMFDKDGNWAQAREYHGAGWVGERFMDQATRIRLMQDEDVAKLDAVIDHILANGIAIPFAAKDRVIFSDDPQKYQNELFVQYPNFLAAIDDAFEEYRQRFFLLSAFVQQQALDGRANLMCQSAVAKIPDRAGSADEMKVLPSVHPAVFAQALAAGVFRDELKMAEYVRQVLRYNDAPICATKTLPKEFQGAAVKLWRVMK